MTQVMDFYRAFATDEKAEVTGRALVINGVKFYVARAGNSAYNDALQLSYKSHEHVFKLGNSANATAAEKQAAEDLSNDQLREIMARTILVGWDGAIPFNGEMLTYSPDSARKLLDLKDFRERIVAFAAQMENYLVEQEAEDVKNSESTSNGT